MILMPENVPEAFDTVTDAIGSGSLSPEWLDETAGWILAFKQTHGILVLP